METLIFIALVIIIILLLGIKSKQKEIAEKNQHSIQSLKKELRDIKEAGSDITIPDGPTIITTDDTLQWRQHKTAEPEHIFEPKPTTPQPLLNKKEEEVIHVFTNEPVEENEAPFIKPIITETPTESWAQKWFQNNPDLEKFVGENLVNKIGITVLVLGIAFFVKYAIDQNWITETGRVVIGVGCGITLTGIAHYLRNSYRSFSSVMAGGGIAVFYFTIAFAYHEYQLFSQTTAFIIMIIITAFAVMLALLYDKIELAVIAIIGGFIAPFLVSSGSGNYIVLFTYLLVLNIGMLSIAYFKKWPVLLALAYFFTWFIFGGWLIKDFAWGNDILPYQNALFFASAFYLIFLISGLVNNLRNQIPFKRFDFSFLLLITFSFYAQGMFILSEWNNGFYQGLFTIAMGLFNLCLAWYLFKTQKGDRNILYLLIGITLTFISLAAPVQLNGYTITLFWSAECVLLYWLYQKSDIRIFKYSSALILFLMVFSLLMDWSITNEKDYNFLPVIFINWQGIITNIVAIFSLVLYSFLLGKPQLSNEYIARLLNKQAAMGFAIAAAILLYITCLFGVNLYFIKVQSFDIPNVYHQLITYILILLYFMYTIQMKGSLKPAPSIILILAGFVFYLFSSRLSNNLMTAVIKNEYLLIHSVIHWLSAASMLGLLYYFIKIYRTNTSTLGNGFAWLINIILLIFFSIECKYVYITILAQPQNIETFISQYLKAGLTIVWASFSFVIIWLGMKYKYKTLRIIALSIFTVALLKLFLFDIRNISEGGKIAAFIMLGILLLVISFMYQRLKKIIIDNEEKII